MGFTGPVPWEISGRNIRYCLCIDTDNLGVQKQEASVMAANNQGQDIYALFCVLALPATG